MTQVTLKMELGKLQVLMILLSLFELATQQSHLREALSNDRIKGLLGNPYLQKAFNNNNNKPRRQVSYTIQKHISSNTLITTHPNGSKTYKTTVHFYNSHGRSYKFEMNEPMPQGLSQRDMVNWVENNSNRFQLTDIPYIPQGSTQQQTNPNQLQGINDQRRQELLENPFIKKGLTQNRPQIIHTDPSNNNGYTKHAKWNSVITTDPDGRQTTKTTVYYYNSNEGSYKFDLDGSFPASQEQIVEWVEANSYKYQLTHIPFVPYKQDTKQVTTPQPTTTPTIMVTWSSPTTQRWHQQTPEPIENTAGKPWNGEMPDVCGKLGIGLRNKVVGGKRTPIENSPWQVAIVRIGTYSLHCGGSIISKRHVISASHCFFRRVKDEENDSDYVPMSDDTLAILAGNSDIRDHRKVYHIEYKVLHSQYSISHRRNDIALVLIKEEFTFGTRIFPICLPPAKMASYTPRRKCLISGWGRTDSEKDNENLLRSLELPINTEEECKTKNSHFVNISSGMFCAGDFYNGGKDSCLGDSGGPFACQENGQYQLYGITSFGIGCGEALYPGVYVKVAKYMKWIHDKLALTKS